MSVDDRHIECRPDVLAGEPVLRGTRISARHIADVIRSGASQAEVAEQLEITLQQVEAALAHVRDNGKDAAV